MSYFGHKLVQHFFEIWSFTVLYAYLQCMFLHSQAGAALAKLRKSSAPKLDYSHITVSLLSGFIAFNLLSLVVLEGMSTFLTYVFED